MKTQKLVYVLTIFLLIIGCSKEENASINFEAKACMQVTQKEIYVDSLVQFNNCSDSIGVTYLWKFGDGCTSIEKEPKHIYKVIGEYKVTLTLLGNNTPIDSTSMNIIVSEEAINYIGEKLFQIEKYTRAIDFAEALDGSIIVYGSSASEFETKYFLAKFDKYLRKKWIKYLDGELNPIVRKIECVSDGNFIITGSFDNSINIYNYFTLSKIDPNGNILWNKIYPETMDYNYYATESLEGGFISVCVEGYEHPLGSIIGLVRVMKLDETGNLIWKRLFSEDWLLNSAKIISLSDGYIFASSTGECLNCQDTLVLTKLGFNGTTIWQTKVELMYSANIGWSSTLAANNQSIVVQNIVNSEYFVFDSNGKFIKKSNSGVSVNRFISTTKNGKFIIGGGYLYGESIVITGLDENGSFSWSKNYGITNSTCYPARGYSLNAKPLLDGNILVLGVIEECDTIGGHSVLLLKINEEGE